ncbi:MAG: Mur ligase family protein [Acidimicrobiales bacterium]
MSGPGPWGVVGALGPSRLHGGTAWVVVVACAAACVPAGLRWLRVAQREHYLAGSVSRFAGRWWRTTPLNVALSAVALGATVVSFWWPIAAVATAGAVAAGPMGLSVRGRTSALAWTRRLRTLAAVWAALELVVLVVGALIGPVSIVAAAAVLAVPLLVDAACLVTSPLELRRSGHFVDDAAARLARVAPTVVAVTGSYGKTSTKGHIVHLVRPSLTIVATPASFNNRAGLARAINEHLADGTEVFVAEMGTYGPGEIADLCRWGPPDVAVITAIGPVHLERFRSEDRIVEAKSEITGPADDVVLQVDDPRLAALADRLASQGKRVVRCSTSDRTADVCVVRSGDGSHLSAYANGEALAEDVELPTGLQPSNLACAIAVALLLKVDAATIGDRVRDLPGVEHRLQAVSAVSGATILDDTYNSNPAGASEALAALAGSAEVGEPVGSTRQGRLLVVTPGMVELGSRQFEENRRFGAAAAAVATDLLIVGRTNRKALLAGVASVPGASVSVKLLRDRNRAVDWVKEHVTAGDTVLYENDLPDHYP